MKKIFVAISFWLLAFSGWQSTVNGQSIVTRTCIVCGQEWEEIISTRSNSWYSLDGATIMLSSYNIQEEKGKEWSVSLHDNAFLCGHCNKIYGDVWRERVKNYFNLELEQAVSEQKEYSAKVKVDIKIKRLKELEEKLNELKKEIDEVRK